MLLGRPLARWRDDLHKEGWQRLDTESNRPGLCGVPWERLLSSNGLQWADGDILLSLCKKWHIVFSISYFQVY